MAWNVLLGLAEPDGAAVEICNYRNKVKDANQKLFCAQAGLPCELRLHVVTNGRTCRTYRRQQD